MATAAGRERAEDADDIGMATLTARHDWSVTPLGPRTGWPQSLRTAVDMMLGSGHAMCLAWGPDRTLLYNDAYAPILGARHPQALGQPLAEVWPELWDDIGPLVERTFAGESATFRDTPLVMTRHGYPEETWWDFAYSPVRDESGAVAGLFNVTSDSTARVVAERDRDLAQVELRERETFLRNVLAASTDCIKVIELDGTMSFMSEGGMRVMEVEDFAAVDGCAWPKMLKDDGPALASAAIDAARAGRSSHFEAAADTYLGTPKHWSISVSPIRDESGAVVRVLSVSRDHTALQESRAQQRLLNDELSHRLKNVLAMVQSIAGQTLRDAASLEAAAAAFAARLVSLGRATDVLTASAWRPAAMGEVIDAGLAAVGGARDRITATGPAIVLDAQAALALTLAVHELATNATKYGAFSSDAGMVTIAWDVDDADGGPQLSFAWRERGGPTVVPPTRRGFGSRMIERSLRAYFRGEATLDYPPAGVEFRITAPLSEIGARGAD